MYKPIEIAIDDIEYIKLDGKEIISVDIPKVEMDDITTQCKRWACQNKPGNWGKGVLPNAVEIGLRGETGFAKVTREEIDIAVKAANTGAGTDFCISGIDIEVKTTKMGDDHHRLMVRCMTENGNDVPLHAHVYVAAHWSRKNAGNVEVVQLLGWVERRDLLKLESVQSKAKDAYHWNKEIPHADLNPMRDLFDIIL